MPALHQFVPTLESGAVGSHILQVQRLFQEKGWQSEIFYEFAKGKMAEAGKTLDAYDDVKASDDIAVYHMAIGSSVAEFTRDLEATFVLDHHNLTPVEFLEPWEPGATYGVQWGRAQLRDLAPHVALGLGDSTYNKQELDTLGYPNTAVAPILLDLTLFEKAVNEEALNRLRSDKRSADWLFVGRISANKCQHDLIKYFAFYKQVIDTDARLHLVGGSASASYFQALQSLIAALELESSVFLHGSVSDGELAAHYENADVFVCVSEHEGFCVPLLEAMHHELPIVAYASSAIPETLGNGGLLVREKSAAVVAASVQRVLSDDKLRLQLINAAHARLEHFSLENTRAVFFDVIAALSKGQQ